MSRRPGLGASWFQKFKGDVHPGDFVVVDGRPRKPPRFYDQQLSADELERVRRVRSVRARMRASLRIGRRRACGFAMRLRSPN